MPSDPSPPPDLVQRLLARRALLANVYTGLAGIGLATLLDREAPAAPAAAGKTHFPAQAQQVLQLFCPGAASHMDLWEHKPEL
ncbi:MAG: DUF1501 domain-containing protein, partial [Armatimonadetes bacterium]|nr:DUF1501 domain-containing protein [Armatimonadota bacterium]